MAATRRVLIGLPAYNEEIALPRLLARIAPLAKSSAAPMTVVLYNDGSSDATVPIAREWQSRLSLVILDGVVNKGLGAGLRALVEYAVAQADDDDVLVVMDCDDTHDPAQIGDMLDKLAAGTDVAIGSRYVRGATVRGVPAFRRLTALGAAGLFKSVHPVRGVWDYTCGYRAYRVAVLKQAAAKYGDALIAERGFACMVELLLKLNALGVRFAEIPLRLRYDLKPTATKMGVGSNMRRLLLLLVRWRWRGFDGA
ncbi:MAG TPA: glycosyltransferase family 2 protein [Xanthobacteraceae bacterium]|nr:glycosyltransferase family 2 protein [Xanthobacteraceae bacterium]